MKRKIYAGGLFFALSFFLWLGLTTPAFGAIAKDDFFGLLARRSGWFIKGYRYDIFGTLDLSTNHVESYICRKSKRSARQISYVYSYSGKRRCETS